MSQWGKLDRLEQVGTATANTGSSTIVLSTQRATAANGWAVGKREINFVSKPAPEQVKQGPY